MKNRFILLALLAVPLAGGADPGAPSGASHGAKGAGANARPAGAKPAPATASGEMSAYLTRPDRKVPLFSERFATTPVATVDDEVITLRQLDDALAGAHAQHKQGDHAKTDVGPILDRLIDMRLLVLEARDMELDKLPKVRAAVAAFEQAELRSAVERRATRGLKPDAMEVEQKYRESVKHWKIRSVLFPAEVDAKAFAAQVKAGKAYPALAKQALASKKAKGQAGAQSVGAKDMLPKVLAAVSALKPGDTTDPVAVEGGFAVVHLDGLQYPDDRAARAKAEAESVERRQAVELQRYRADLEKRYARIDLKLLQALDFEAKKPGFEAMKKDRRTVATIAGEGPITVGELTTELEAGFFHGMEGPIKEKRVNSHKDEALRVMVTKRLFLKEAKRLGIASTAEYRDAVAEFERGQLFGQLAEKVIIPDVKVMEVEGKDYYAKHKAEFTYPAFYRLEGLAFSSSRAAQAALKRLQAGTEFKWLRANSDGLIPADKQQLQLEGTTFSAKSLPPELVSALAGAGRGDYRLFETAGPQYYVVHVLEQAAPKEQPYASVRDGIVKRVFSENLAKAIKEYAAKLRKTHKVEVFITRIGD
ncbi:peptidyl-prolyl cis-trans isomerase [Anaeromyxobacter oryzisoli]|uniref:peptidyl-prolyl cis-trans isomerase n=1 Tax=Anaeromyxobacter oryzisoli TaxID=2925408 RepID=UPI001F5972B4|nr:peptidyl-prolyl cis-trans isomerase [Anaeromyxobacter sp. SG63]